MRQYIPSVFPDKDGLITVDGKDFRYMKNVLRLKVGDMVSVRLPDGSLCDMTLCTADEKRRRILLQVCNVGDNSSAVFDSVRNGVSASALKTTSTEYYLIQFIPKPQKMDLIVRQAAECGITAVIPVIGEYSQADSVSALGSRMERLARIIHEARQQSGSPVETKVLSAVDLPGLINYWHRLIAADSDTTAAFVLSERNGRTRTIYSVLSAIHDVGRAALAVGSEGGISPSEISELENAGFVPVHFNTNILRCETAALYGTAAVQSAVAERLLWQNRE